MDVKSMSPEMQACIENCQECHRTCTAEAFTHCLPMGGRHVAPEHLTVMLLCAEMCQTCLNFMLSGSDLHRLTCGVCAKVCTACAESCEALDGMEACAAICQKCAESCASMAG